MAEAATMDLETPLEILGDDVLVKVLGFCGVVVLERAKLVNKRFLHSCTQAIRQKPGNVNPRAFRDSGTHRPREDWELLSFAKQYMEEYKVRDDLTLNHDKAEKIAQTYGWPIGKWDVSEVRDFSFVFANQYNDGNFNEDISGWNTKSALSMNYMFGENCLFNQKLPWDVSNVTNMDSMFFQAKSFNQPLRWNTEKLSSIDSIFSGATSFNQPLLWKTENVTDFHEAFCRARSFNQDLSTWTISESASTFNMFTRAQSLENQHRPRMTADQQRSSVIFEGLPVFC